MFPSVAVSPILRVITSLIRHLEMARTWKLPAVPNPGQRTETIDDIDEYRNYFWDFGQVQLLTDTRECVQFLGTVCSRHRMWEKAVNTTMPAQIFRIVEFQ